jgi:hypothetical protein
MTYYLSMENTSTLSKEIIHITFRCAMHLHGHRNKMVPLMKPFILTDLNNGVKLRNYICWSINNTHSHCLSCHVNNHHINNKNMVLTSPVKISHNETFDIKGYYHSFHTMCPLSRMRAYMTSLMASCVAIH